MRTPLGGCGELKEIPPFAFPPTIPASLIPAQSPTYEVDWSAFRREAAKDFVSAIISNPQWIYGAEGGGLFKNKESVISNAIMYADELIRQLKEEQK